MKCTYLLSKTNLPNKSYAGQWLKGLEKRLKRDEKYRSDYVNFMQDISCGDAENVPLKELDN